MPTAVLPSALRSPKRRRLNETIQVQLRATAEPSAFVDVKNNASDDNYRSFKCAECAEVFVSQTKLAKHGKETRHQPFACQEEGCTKRYSKWDKLTRHFETVHVRGSGQVLEELKCAECGEVFVYQNYLAAHGKETRHRPFACQEEGCTKSYSKREHLTRHFETVHVRGSGQDKPFKCELCAARFTYKHALTRHMKRSHRNVNVPFECAECLMAFKKKSELQAHSYVHTGVLPFECEDCGERFLKRFLLNRHRRKHIANEKADTQVYMCDCGEICFDEEELRTHKQTAHTVEASAAIGKAEPSTSPALVCLVCDQTFSRKQYLRAHLRTHFESRDDRKQFTCPMDGCDKAYTRSSNLMAHYNAVHDERKSKRFACPRDGCSARFGYKTVLKYHIESIHDNPIPAKRRERKSASIFQRALGLHPVGQEVIMTEDSETKPIAINEEEKE